MAESRDGPNSDTDAATESIPTAPGDPSVGRLRRGRFGRRLFFVLLCLLLGAAGLGLLGVRTAEARGSGGGYEVVVTYSEIVRPGLGVPWELEIRHPGGFGGVVTVAAASSYFEIFDENGFDPDPLSATTDEERIIWTFEPPGDSDTMTVSFDARVEPGVQLERAKGFVSVLEEGEAVVTVNFSTLVLA